MPTTKKTNNAWSTNKSDAGPPISSIQPQMSAIVDINEFFHFFPKSTLFSEMQCKKTSDNHEEIMK
jgi:hypothetical protein